MVQTFTISLKFNFKCFHRWGVVNGTGLLDYLIIYFTLPNESKIVNNNLLLFSLKIIFKFQLKAWYVKNKIGFNYTETNLKIDSSILYTIGTNRAKIQLVDIPCSQDQPRTRVCMCERSDLDSSCTPYFDTQ